jgi:integrase
VAKDDYRIPDDALLRRTFEALESSKETHRDRYVAIWLALGFGLRKSEAAAVRAGWFLLINGRLHLELRGVIQPGTPGRESTATKSGEVAPRIPVANGAWSHLEPFVTALAPQSHVLAPNGTPTYRVDALFDEISAWLRGLGWETDKAFHEFRALAGCWVAMNDGLLVARDWLRHSSVTTTERHYGRYVRTSVTDRPVSVLDTSRDSIQTVPNDAKLTSFGGNLGAASNVEVFAFRGDASASSCGTTDGRP